MECPICFDSIEVATTGITTMACSHSFHFHCLAKWFIMQTEEQQSCPCCRREATLLERQPVEEEIGEDSESESEEEDDDDWPGRNDVFVSITPEMTTQYTLTSSWVQQPNGRWVRQQTVAAAAQQVCAAVQTALAAEPLPEQMR